jgi:hypothetical protein
MTLRKNSSGKGFGNISRVVQGLRESVRFDWWHGCIDHHDRSGLAFSRYQGFGHRFPHTLELFSRVPDGLSFVPLGHLTPIPIGEKVSSLSAILLDDAYYQFVLSGRNNKHGIPSWIGEDRLIPLKAVAWMEMTQRVQQGEEIDLKKINKHLNDIVLLSALLQPGQVIDLPEKIKSDLQAFAKFVVEINRSEQVQAMRRIASSFAFDLPMGEISPRS